MNEMQSGPRGRFLSKQGGRVHPDLEALLVLQDKDVAVASCDTRLRALDPELRALDEQIAVAERVVDQARAGIQAALDRRDGLEGKIASYRTMQEQRRQRLEWVRGAKEASTLMAELDLARSVLAKEEAEFMRSGDAVTEAERRAAEAEKALDEVRVAQAPLREALAGKRDQIAAQRERAVAERDRAATQVAAASAPWPSATGRPPRWRAGCSAATSESAGARRPWPSMRCMAMPVATASPPSPRSGAR